MSELRNYTRISGVVVGKVFHKEGSVLRFTLAGESYALDGSGELLFHYQEVFVPGRRADELAPQVQTGHAYMVSGPLLRSDRGSRHQIKTFEVTPINRNIESEGGGVDRRNQRRMTDAHSLILIRGNLGRVAVSGHFGQKIVARASVATDIFDRRPGQPTVKECHWIPLIAAGSLMESLLAGEKGSEIFGTGNLITERLTHPEGSMTRSVCYLNSLEYTGESHDEDPVWPEHDELSSGARLERAVAPPYPPR